MKPGPDLSDFDPGFPPPGKEPVSRQALDRCFLGGLVASFVLGIVAAAIGGAGFFLRFPIAILIFWAVLRAIWPSRGVPNDSRFESRRYVIEMLATFVPLGLIGVAGALYFERQGMLPWAPGKPWVVPASFLAWFVVSMAFARRSDRRYFPSTFNTQTSTPISPRRSSHRKR